MAGWKREGLGTRSGNLSAFPVLKPDLTRSVNFLFLSGLCRRRRYFLLFSDPFELRYFNGDKLKGTIDMCISLTPAILFPPPPLPKCFLLITETILVAQVQAISKSDQPWTKSLSHCYSFELHTPKRVYFISCDSEGELLSWMGEIRKVMISCGRPVSKIAPRDSNGSEGGHANAKGEGGKLKHPPGSDEDEVSEDEGIDESDIVPEVSGHGPLHKSATDNRVPLHIYDSPVALSKSHAVGIFQNVPGSSAPFSCRPHL